MNHLKIIFCLSILLGISQPAYSEWMSEAEVCKLQNKSAGCVQGVTPKNSLPYWAAKILAFEIIDDRPTSNMRLQITWVTSQSNYSCGQIIVMNYDNLEDFTHRSIMMKKCK